MFMETGQVSHKTGQMSRLDSVFTGCIGHCVCFFVLQLVWGRPIIRKGKTIKTKGQEMCLMISWR